MAKITSVIAREEDGGIQITFTIPFQIVKKAQDETLEEFAKDVEVPGYRKGKAPVEKVKEKISQSALIEHSLGHILPEALAESVKENGLALAIYPRFEVVKTEEGKDWEVVAKTCVLPEVSLGDYKAIVSGEIRAASLKKELSREEKEQVVIKALLQNIKITIPKVLTDEEVNSRLSSLLSRIEKLGLQLESYLTSIGKNPQTIREEYEVQAKDAISLDLILSKIADDQKITVTDKEVDEALKMVNGEANSKPMITAQLKKRKALEFLTNLS